MKFMLLFFFLLYLSLKPSMSSSSAAAEESAYEVLQAHGLPRGLLPKGITEFRFDDDGGKFEAVLEAPCTAKFESGVHYNATVSGALSYGQIAPLSGVSAQELFLWFPVLGIRVDVPSSGLIHFDVGGVVHKQFPLSLFDSPPDCTPDDDDQSTTVNNHSFLICHSILLYQFRLIDNSVSVCLDCAEPRARSGGSSTCGCVKSFDRSILCSHLRGLIPMAPRGICYYEKKIGLLHQISARRCTKGG